MKHYAEQILEERAYDIRDMKVLRLARRIVLEEVNEVIILDKDTEGNPLNSEKGGELLFYSGENTSITSPSTSYMQLNNLTGDSHWYASVVSDKVGTDNNGSVVAQKKIDMRIINGMIMITALASYQYASGGSTNLFGGGVRVPQTAITAIKLFLAVGTFPAGTIIEWYEYV